jgi:hypothetical protein
MPTAVMYDTLIGGRRGEGNGRHSPNASRPRSSQRQRGRVWRGEMKAEVRMDLD